MGQFSMEKITATGNGKIKYAVKLSSSSAFRKENGEFFLEGARLCSDAAKSGVQIIRAFLLTESLEKYKDYIAVICENCGEIYEISRDVSEKLGDTGNSQGVFCICKMPGEEKGVIDKNGKYLALENVQDPSNTGAISRSAEAIGLDGLIVSGGCDIYNPKALRAAMGSSLRLPIIVADDMAEIIAQAKKKGMKTFASVPDKSAKDIRTVKKDGGVICCVGNEGNGLSEKTIDACDEKITIPMSGRAESFNASAAAAILAWELKR